MMKAIVTKYIGPTDHKGSRIKVKAEGLPAMILSWDDALHVNANHTQAAKAYAKRFGWYGAWFGGGMPDQTGNCYVRVDYPNARMTKLDLEDSFYIEIGSD